MKSNIQNLVTQIKSNIPVVAVVALIAIIVIAIFLGIFWLKRTINYNLYYKDKVEEHVNELVNKKFDEELPARIEEALFRRESNNY